MKRTDCLIGQLAILILATLASYTWAQQAGAPAVVTQTITATATIKAVYPDKRSLTLVGADGQPTTVFVSQDVDLSKLKAGDKVNVSYYQGIAAQIAKGATKTSDPAASNFAYHSPSGAPGGGAGSSVTVTVKILGVDPGTNTVAFQTDDGSRHVIAVKSPNMIKFVNTLKPGEIVDVTYTGERRTGQVSRCAAAVGFQGVGRAGRELTVLARLCEPRASGPLVCLAVAGRQRTQSAATTALEL